MISFDIPVNLHLSWPLKNKSSFRYFGFTTDTSAPVSIMKVRFVFESAHLKEIILVALFEILKIFNFGYPGIDSRTLVLPPGQTHFPVALL